ncbi:MAG: YitT family protein, partial [Catenibacillus sp.]
MKMKFKMTIQRWKSVFWLTLGTLLMTVGVYFFKFPNNFTFGGVTGFAVLIAKFVPLSASDVSFWLNMILLLVGFIFFGKRFGAKTAYTSVLLSVT